VYGVSASYTVRILAAAIAAALALGVAVAQAAENETFGLRPHPATVDGVARSTFEVPLEPGATFRDRVRVYNRTNQAIELVLYAVDAQTTRGGEINIGVRNTKPTGVGSWIKLSRTSLQLGSKEDAVVGFTVHVETDAPAPDLGAIVAENTTRRSGGVDLAQRLHVVVKTAPPGTPVAAERVPRGLRSPWWWIGFSGLLLAAYIVWRRTRRARRDPDLEPAEADEDADYAPEEIAVAQPQIIHLGERPEAEPDTAEAPVTKEIVLRGPAEETDVPEPAPPERPRRQAPRTRRPARRTPQPVQRRRREADEDMNYIPLDEL
jgi:hypothetical protein